MEDESKPEAIEEEIPRFRVPARTYALAGLGILGILALGAVMLYTWAQVL